MKVFVFKVSKNDGVFIEGTFTIYAPSKRKAKKKFRKFGKWEIKSITEKND